MKTWKIFTITITALAIAATLLASTALAMPWGWGTNSQNGWFGGMMGRGGMMGGYGYGYGYNNQYNTQPGTTPNTQYYQPVYPFQFGGGCHGRFGWNGGYANRAPYTNNGDPIDIETAKTIAENYIASTGNLDLTIKEIEEYSANFYAQVTEKSTGNGAFELIVNKFTGSIYPEMGPNMMWNNKYGMMRGGALGGIFGTPTTTMTVSATQAKANAEQYLTSYISGATTGDVTTFYGYYTIEVLKDGTPYGMISVNGYSGQVWFHTWHGTFIQELD